MRQFVFFVGVHRTMTTDNPLRIRTAHSPQLEHSQVGVEFFVNNQQHRNVPIFFPKRWRKKLINILINNYTLQNWGVLHTLLDWNTSLIDMSDISTLSMLCWNISEYKVNRTGSIVWSNEKLWVWHIPVSRRCTPVTSETLCSNYV